MTTTQPTREKSAARLAAYVINILAAYPSSTWELGEWKVVKAALDELARRRQESERQPAGTHVPAGGACPKGSSRRC